MAHIEPGSMTLADVIRRDPLDEAKPLTPEQARTRADKLAAANAKLADTRAAAAIKVQAAQRKASSI